MSKYQTFRMSEKNFFDKVYEVVRQIPPGKVTTYGAIARFVGSAGSSRMVGWALNSSKNIPDYIPAHRVVNRNGLLTGKRHFGTPGLMQQLLENEGVKIKNEQIVEMEKHFWDPVKELGF